MPKVIATSGLQPQRQFQQLSCREAGAFDWKRQEGGTWRDTAWTAVCHDRAARGVSRRARIRGK